MSNMKLWDAVSKTDPKYTKKVNQRGGFTAIDAHYQVQEATKAFGSVGIYWGYDVGAPIFGPHDLLLIPVTLWVGDRRNTFGPQYGCAAIASGKAGQEPRPDTDAAKKATTDAITKLLSHLGFNADVFLGKFDDNKYVADRKREVEAASNPHTEQIDKVMSVMKEAETMDDLNKAIGLLSGIKDELKQKYGGAYQGVVNYYTTRKKEIEQ
tara:strand:+ start:2764 stop:3393 length:630 start_codon:yes stop_codon:yes gene_type:complete